MSMDPTLTVAEAASMYNIPAAVWSRPSSAEGAFLRILTVTDIYKLDNYPYVASAIIAACAGSIPPGRRNFYLKFV